MIRAWLWTLLLFVVGLPLLVLVGLRWLPAPTSSFMIQSQTRPVQYQWVAMDRISPYAGLAVIAAEDQKFPQHWGFDIESIQKAVEENEHRSRPRGASTISQQTAKNLFLWSGGGYFRKGLEAGFTAVIELLWPKRRILEIYLNIAEFGPGIYGVEAAARAHFGISASQLSMRQCALLAAVLPNPRELSASAPTGYVVQRADWIQGQMNHLGLAYISGLD